MTIDQKRFVPLTSDDLRQIAERYDQITSALSVDPFEEIPEGDWMWGLSVTIWDEHGYVLGHVKPHGDGWFGFYPVGASDD